MDSDLSPNSKWAVEIEWNDGLIEYFSLDSLEVSDEYVRMDVTLGAIIEVERQDIRKLLVMRTHSEKLSSDKSADS